MKQIIAIYGPTGSGKSQLALELYNKYNNLPTNTDINANINSNSNKTKTSNQCHLISIDSRKIYKEIDIGTNKLKLKNFINENPNTKIFGIDLYNINQKVSVSDFQDKVYEYILNLLYEKDVPDTLIFFGGSGLYLDTILFGLISQNIEPNIKLRQKLENSSLIYLQKQLLQIHPQWYKSLNNSEINNKQRLIRKIEIATSLQNKNEKLSLNQNKIANIKNLFDKANLTLYIPDLEKDKEFFYEKINTRVKNMFLQGWLTEVHNLLIKYKVYSNQSIAKQVSKLNLNNRQTSNEDLNIFDYSRFNNLYGLQILGYDKVVNFLKTYKNENDNNLKDLISEIQTEHCHLARQQLIWARRYLKGIDTLYPQKMVNFEEIEVKSY